MSNTKKILFINHLIKGTDKISLQITKQASSYQKLGHKVYFLTGDNQGKKDKNKVFLIPELGLDFSEIIELKEALFQEEKYTEDDILDFYASLENYLYQELDNVIEQIKPDLIYVHNIFSLSDHLPATTALIQVLDKYQIPTITVNHYFWFNNPSFSTPIYEFVSEIQALMPPTRSYFLEQQVENVTQQKLLKKKRKVNSTIINQALFLDRI